MASRTTRKRPAITSPTSRKTPRLTSPAHRSEEEDEEEEDEEDEDEEDEDEEEEESDPGRVESETLLLSRHPQRDWAQNLTNRSTSGTTELLELLGNSIRDQNDNNKSFRTELTALITDLVAPKAVPSAEVLEQVVTGSETLLRRFRDVEGLISSFAKERAGSISLVRDQERREMERVIGVGRRVALAEIREVFYGGPIESGRGKKGVGAMKGRDMEEEKDSKTWAKIREEVADCQGVKQRREVEGKSIAEVIVDVKKGVGKMVRGLPEIDPAEVDK